VICLSSQIGIIKTEAAILPMQDMIKLMKEKALRKHSLHEKTTQISF